MLNFFSLSSLYFSRSFRRVGLLSPSEGQGAAGQAHSRGQDQVRAPPGHQRGADQGMRGDYRGGGGRARQGTGMKRDVGALGKHYTKKLFCYWHKDYTINTNKLFCYHWTTGTTKWRRLFRSLPHFIKSGIFFIKKSV